MPNWEYLMDVYESNDIDSLCEEAVHHANVIYDWLVRRSGDKSDSLMTVYGFVVYFINTDDFFDGAECDIFRAIFDDDSLYYKGRRWYGSNGDRVVEQYYAEMPYSIKENFLRLGCCFYAAKGYMKDEEKNRIRRLS